MVLYDAHRKKISEAWIDKARKQIDAVTFHAERGHWSESVQASQEAIELSVKAVLTLLNVDYPASHKLGRPELGQIALQLRKRGLLGQLKTHLLFRVAELPRLLLLANLWADTNVTAKYGLEVEFLAGPEDLFKQQEALLAKAHAEECLRAASDLFWAPEDVLCALVSE